MSPYPAIVLIAWALAGDFAWRDLPHGRQPPRARRAPRTLGRPSLPGGGWPPVVRRKRPARGP